VNKSSQGPSPRWVFGQTGSTYWLSASFGGTLR